MIKRRVVALVQARMGSTRLPAKSLLHLHGHPLIDWVVQRAARAELLDDFVAALPATMENDPLAAHLERKNVSVHRGPEQDVLERMRQAGEKAGATHVVRICADNPLIWGGEIDNLIRWYFDNPCDYAYNHIPVGNSYPDGLGAEIVSMALFREVAETAFRPEHREHCLSYIWFKKKPHYSISTFDPPDETIRRPDLKLDVDTLGDYRKLAMAPLTIDSAPQEIVGMFPRKSQGGYEDELLCPGRH